MENKTLNEWYRENKKRIDKSLEGNDFTIGAYKKYCRELYEKETGIILEKENTDDNSSK